MGYSDKLSAWMMKSLLSLPLTGLFIVSGCHFNESEPPKTAVTVQSPQPSNGVSTPLPSAKLESQTTATAESETYRESSSSTGTATVCQRELAALSKINPAKYATQKGVFDNLLKSVSVYSTVRDDVNPGTKDIMDTLYKYKTQKICNDIQQAINESLIARGENVK
ncbi:MULTISPECIES: hypothetical protein [unclassified Atlantibacter]|uniref:hypothetical protein n=1 Tax=unclassified Atlantibacter TaxID=2649394 RepID=UPI00160569E8|nr:MULTISPECIES: hypothetical protein [unclassified Atlantibacter]MBB3324125.1 hypothetical protein [Atlantibacter sp. RC6]